MPAVSMLIMALSLYFSMVIAAKYQVFDYSSWSRKLYGSASTVMAPLFEILFNSLLVLVTAVAFATGGSTIAKAFGTSYMLNTVAIAAVHFRADHLWCRLGSQVGDSCFPYSYCLYFCHLCP